MRLVIKIAVFTTVLLFTISCTYDFSEDYFKEIKTNGPNVNISLSGFTNGEETRSSKMVQYAISGVIDYEFEMIVIVNEVEIYRSQERTGDFYLFVDDLNDGDHNLTVKYISPTKSGSLADAVGGEFYTGEISYSFTLDKSLADPFGIESINIIEGSIYINLNPIQDDNFEEAFLVIKNEYDFILEERPISQEDLTDLQIHDNQTLIYNPRYAIKVKNAFKEDISDFLLLPTEKMQFIHTRKYIDGLLYSVLIYTGHPFYNNFDIMRIEYRGFYSGYWNYIINPLGGEKILVFSLARDSTIYPILKFFKNDILIERISDPAHKIQFN